jgi:hypothetical protein
MEKELTKNESLELISQMIGTAKNNLQKGTGRVFLLWGYLVAGISLLTTILLIALPSEISHYAYFGWCLMAFGYPLHYRILKKIEAKQLVSTYIDRLTQWLWTAFTFSILVVIAGLLITSFIVLPFFTATEPGHDFLYWFQWLFMTPFMLCLYGFALYISGKAYGFKPLVAGGAVCWASTLLLLVVMHHPQVLILQQILLCISVVAGFVIPGHLLEQKEKRNV